jgi:hypothetical protein
MMHLIGAYINPYCRRKSGVKIAPCNATLLNFPFTLFSGGAFVMLFFAAG